MKVYEIRKKVFNADIKQWEKINNLCHHTASMCITTMQFFSYVGYCRCLTAKCNSEEIEFFDKITEIAKNFGIVEDSQMTANDQTEYAADRREESARDELERLKAGIQKIITKNQSNKAIGKIQKLISEGKS